MERRVNDVGGLVNGAFQPEEHAVTLHEKRVDALVMLLTSPRIDAFKVDALRRAVEQNSAEDYRKFGYYDKWIRAIRDLLIEQKILSHTEIEARISVLQSRQRRDT